MMTRLILGCCGMALAYASDVVRKSSLSYLLIIVAGALIGLAANYSKP